MPIKKNILVMSILMFLLFSQSLYSTEVVTTHSTLKDKYYQGDTLILRIAILNNGSSDLQIKKVNISIFRVEKRYNRLRNVELVFNGTYKENTKISINHVYSREIRIKLTFTPSQYNITASVLAKFTAGAAGETLYYVIKSHIFRIEPSFSLPIFAWTAIVISILLGLTVFIYRKLRV